MFVSLRGISKSPLSVGWVAKLNVGDNGIFTAKVTHYLDWMKPL
jgi:hypothetical protein